jgi:hypothetical protein
MKRVTCVRKGQLIVLNSTGVTLRFGGTPFRYDRFVVSRDVFLRLRQQNPDVEFVDRTKK